MRQICRDKGDDVWIDHWYGFNDRTAAEFVERLELPSKIR